MKSFIPGQLVRLRYYWDDIDDDVEYQANENRAPSPAYYATRCDRSGDDGGRWGCDAIYPGQIGMFLDYAKIKGVEDPNAFLAIVLIGEQRYKFPPRTLEAYDKQGE